jgi:hypothetical protein
VSRNTLGLRALTGNRIIVDIGDCLHPAVCRHKEIPVR